MSPGNGHEKPGKLANSMVVKVIKRRPSGGFRRGYANGMYLQIISVMEDTDDHFSIETGDLEIPPQDKPLRGFDEENHRFSGESRVSITLW